MLALLLASAALLSAETTALTGNAVTVHHGGTLTVRSGKNVDPKIRPSGARLAPGAAIPGARIPPLRVAALKSQALKSQAVKSRTSNSRTHNPRAMSGKTPSARP
jgi:hypothetical protein